MDKAEAKKLLTKYNRGLASAEERASLENWYAGQSEKQRLTDPDADFSHLKEELYRGTLQRAGLRPEKRGYAGRLLPLRPFAPFIAAASILLIAGFGLYFYMGRTDRPGLAVNDADPGGNKAVLTLADGRKINLDGAGNGELARQAGVQIVKTADGQLTYTLDPSGGEHQASPAFNTIETPRGGQYQVILPDGSKVWLNAASSLKYPAVFGKENRLVELSGEAYFQITQVPKDQHRNTGERKPFIVRTATQDVEVTGTRFNVNSYPDEGRTVTTLEEGSVRVSLGEAAGHRLLLPGQQAVNANGRIEVRPVDPEMVLAWKNGNFVFNGDDLPVVMRQLARWYNVEVESRQGSGHSGFVGSISRSKKLSEILRALEMNQNVRFRIEERRIIVME